MLPRLPQIFARSQREKTALTTMNVAPTDALGSTVESTAAASFVQQRDIARLFDATMARVLRLWAQQWPQEAPDAAQQWAAAECIPNGCAHIELSHSNVLSRPLRVQAND